MRILTVAVFAVILAQTGPPVANPLPSLGVSMTIPPSVQLVDETSDKPNRIAEATYISGPSNTNTYPLLTIRSQLHARSETLQAYAERIALDAKAPIKRSEAHRICNGTQNGWLVEMTNMDVNDHMIAVAGEHGDLAAMAVYHWFARDPNAAPDAEFVKALDSFCVVGRSADAPKLPGNKLDEMLAGEGISLDLPADWALMDMAEPGDKNHGAAAIFMPPVSAATTLDKIQSIVIEVDPVNGRNLARYVADMTSLTGRPPFLESHAFAACHGTQQGWEVVSSVEQSVVHSVFLVTAKHAVTVAYQHSSGMRDDPAAMAALTSFCLQ